MSRGTASTGRTTVGAMDIGLSVASHTTLDARAGAAHLLARVRAAQAAGLASLSFGDHHVVAGDAYFQNTPTLGRALAEWSGRPAGCLFLLPLWHPVLVAEQIGTLAAFHDGPFVLQTGIGGGDQQFAGMGADLATRGQVFEESARIIRALLEGATVSSDHFAFTDARIGLRPPEPVHWWIGGEAPVALRRAARMGDAWYASPHHTPDSIREPLAAYRNACDRAERVAVVMARKDMTISTDRALLERTRDVVAAGRYRGMAPEQVLVATPEEAIEALAPFAELGIAQVVARTMGLSETSDIETIEHLGAVGDALAAEEQT